MKKILFLLFLIPIAGVSQNKKEQIATLNFKLDSLNNKISNERQESKKEIEENEKKMSSQKAQLIKLYDRVKKLNESLESEKGNLNTQKLKNIEVEKLNNKYEQQIGKLNESQENLSAANFQLKESLNSYENGLKKLNENLVDSAGKISQLNNEIQKIYKLLAESKYENSLFIDSIKKLQTKKTATKLFYLNHYLNYLNFDLERWNYYSFFSEEKRRELSKEDGEYLEEQYPSTVYNKNFEPKYDLGILFEGRLQILEKGVIGTISSCDSNEFLSTDGLEDMYSEFTIHCDSSITVESGLDIYCEWKIHNIQNKCYVVKVLDKFEGIGDFYEKKISIFLISYNDNQLKKKLVCDGSIKDEYDDGDDGYELVIGNEEYKVLVNECSGNCSFFNSFLKYHY
jgi:hypothetical protein